MKKIYNLVSYLYFNFLYYSKIKTIKKTDLDENYYIEGLGTPKIGQLFKGHKEIFRSDYSFSVKLVLLFLSKKACFVLREKHTNNALGYMVFLFNRNEAKDGYIHASYLFVLKQYYNLGYGAILENHSLSYIQDNTLLKGIMGRVTLQNKNAVRLLKYNNFEIIEEYFDQQCNEKRAYVLKKFRRDDK